MRCCGCSFDAGWKPVIRLCTVVLCVLCVLFAWAQTAGAQTGGAQTGGAQEMPPDAIDPPAWPRATDIFPAPEPFSVNGYDALQAAHLIRRAGLLVRPAGGKREIVAVRTVEIVEASQEKRIEQMPPGHRKRYDLVLNGEPLDWDSLYIEYGGRLVNLRLLFTYRNQRPAPNIPYSLR